MTRRLGRICATIEARMTSTRLPGKVLKECQGRPMLEHMVRRVSLVPSLEGIVVCTTTNAADDVIFELCDDLGIGVWRGPEDDVMGRVLGGARAYGIDTIVELTGDCPLIDPDLIEAVIDAYRRSEVDYAANVLERALPIGMDTQVFATSVLADAESRTRDPADREHVSLFIYRHPERYRLLNVPAPADLHDPSLRLTLDTAEDFALIETVFARLYPDNQAFTLADILALLKAEPALRRLNEHVRQKTV